MQFNFGRNRINWHVEYDLHGDAVARVDLVPESDVGLQTDCCGGIGAEFSSLAVVHVLRIGTEPFRLVGGVLDSDSDDRELSAERKDKARFDFGLGVGEFAAVADLDFVKGLPTWDTRHGEVQPAAARSARARFDCPLGQQGA